MNIEEFNKLMEDIPIIYTSNPISSYGSVELEDIREAVSRFKKVPSFNDLLKENKKLNEQLNLISDNFLKYDWENSSKEQIINQLHELYNSIFRKDKNVNITDKEKMV